MEELETLVSVSDTSTEDIFADDIERDSDPDYVSDPYYPLPSTSKGVPKAKSSATTSSASVLPKPLPGGKSNAPIWAYYIPDDRKVNGHLEKGAICQINVGG